MDPVELILAAMRAGTAAAGAGANSALRNSASESVSHLYQRLATALYKKFSQRALHENLTLEPSTQDLCEKTCLTRERLVHAGADQDQHILALAMALISLTSSSRTTQVPATIVRGGQIGAIGDHATVTINNRP